MKHSLWIDDESSRSLLIVREQVDILRGVYLLLQRIFACLATALVVGHHHNVSKTVVKGGTRTLVAPKFMYEPILDSRAEFADLDANRNATLGKYVGMILTVSHTEKRKFVDLLRTP